MSLLDGADAQVTWVFFWGLPVRWLGYRLLLHLSLTYYYTFHKLVSVDGDADIQYEDLDQNFDDLNNSG